MKEVKKKGSSPPTPGYHTPPMSSLNVARELWRELDYVYSVLSIARDVRTYVTPKGTKHALVKLAAGSKAEDIANKLKLA